MTQAAVVGGHGKTGRAVVFALHRRGASVMPLGRAELVDPFEALRGSDAVYLIAPSMHPDEPAFISRPLAAAATAKVSKIVYHPVAMPRAPMMPHHMGKARSEDLIRHLPVAWTILQPRSVPAELPDRAPHLTAAADVLDTDVPAVRIEPDAWAARQAAAVEPRVREWLRSMFDYYDRYGLVTGSLPPAALLGRTPTGVRDVLLRELRS